MSTSEVEKFELWYFKITQNLVLADPRQKGQDTIVATVGLGWNIKEKRESKFGAQ